VIAAPPATPVGTAASANCGACGTALAGAYCHACGQPGPFARQRLSEALLGQSGRLLHTLRMPLTRPGELARETGEYRDRGSIRPLTLLLNVVAFFFLLSGLTDFRLQTFERQDESGKLAQALERHAAEAGVGREVFVERVERRFQSLYTLLLVASVVVYAIVLWLTHRRPRRAWLVHVAGAVHYVCFVFLVAVVYFVAFRQFGIASTSIPALAVQIVIAFAYLVLMFRRTYDDALGQALLKGLLVIGVGLVVDTAVFIAALNLALRTV